jgi:hypothetical protein
MPGQHEQTGETFMKLFAIIVIAALAFPFAQMICGAEQAAASDSPKKIEAQKQKEEAEIKESLSKLKPEDRKLAEAQKFCPVMVKNRLGSMGPPIKITIKNRPVFLCCKGCTTRAQANPDKTLTTIESLLKANKKVEPNKK